MKVYLQCTGSSHNKIIVKLILKLNMSFTKCQQVAKHDYQEALTMTQVNISKETLQVLGIANLYPECKEHMHKRLQESSRKHEHNRVDSNLNDVNLAAGWYRIFGEAGNRLLDINDLPKNVSINYVVRLILFSIYVNNLVTLRHIFFPYSELTTNIENSDEAEKIGLSDKAY